MAPPLSGGSWRRRLLRRLPVLARAARTIDRLEAENLALRMELAAIHRLHVREDEPPLTAEELPLPPAALRTWVAGTEDPDWFLASGRLAADTILAALARRGRELQDCRGVLDFGCGCGRVLRHLRPYASAGLHGTDYNQTAIAWCDGHLSFAAFGTNRAAPPTRYGDGAFELIYALSVFTHLTEPLQLAWMEELRRLIRPGGLLMLTTHGAAYWGELNADEQRRFAAGELVVRLPEAVGRNDCGAYHPEAYVRRVLAAGFSVLELEPRGARGNPRQDLYVLERAIRPGAG